MAILNSPTLSGDVSGKIYSTSVDKIKGVKVSTIAPTVNQLLLYDGTEWGPGTVNVTGFAPLSGATFTGAVAGTTATFSTSISAPALSGTFFGDGSKLTGLNVSSYAPLSGATFTGNVTLGESLAGNFQLGSDIDGEATGDRFGYSVSVNAAGDRVAIGAPFNDVGGAKANAGHVRVYSLSGSAWTQLGLDIDGEAAADQSGYSVSMNAAGDRVVIGAPLNDGSGSNAGHVRVYSWNGSAWAQMGSDIDGGIAGNQFGSSVSINAAGDRIAIGSSVGFGFVRIYAWNGSNWSQLGSTIEGIGEAAELGSSVSMNAAGDRIAIGAPSATHSMTGMPFSGLVRVYSWNGNIWSQLGLDLEGEGAISEDNFGWSVAMNATGDRVAIGATANDGTNTFAGQCFIYSWSGSAWTQLGSYISGEAGGDQFGYSVSINGAGDKVAIGAIGNDGAGSNAGHVRVYSWNNLDWTQVNSDIDGGSASERTGHSVSMNKNGDRIVVGAPYTSKGSARAYSIYTPLNLSVFGNGTFTNSVSAPALSGTFFGDASGLTETLVQPSVATSTTFNLSQGTLFRITLNTSITSLTFTNVPSSPKVFSFVLQVIADGTARTIAWPAAVKWPSNTAPTLTSTSGKIDTLTFLTYDGGTTWFGFIMAQNH
jgi:hypothetical protein